MTDRLKEFIAEVTQPFYGDRYLIVNGQSIMVNSQKIPDMVLFGQRLRGVKLTAHGCKPLYSYSQV